MSAAMRAAVIVAPRDVRIERGAVPHPGPGHVRVRLEGCGVCGSNAPVWEGRSWFEYPLRAGAPGHEGWGVVEATGDGVMEPRAGRRVALLSDRAFAEYDVACADSVVVLPDALDGLPFPGEPLGCAFNVFRRSDVRAGHQVAVIGIGFLGALLVRLAANAGARVAAVSRRAFAREVALTCGAQEAIELDDVDDARRRLLDWTDGAGCDRVIEAVGLQEPLDLAGAVARERGRLVIAGYHQDGPRTVDMQLWNWRGLDVINAHERDPAVYVQGMRMAAAAVERGELDPRPLFTHLVPLERLDAAFRMMRERPAGFLKALVMT